MQSMNQRGVTVIEVLVGAFILTTVVTFVTLSLNLYFAAARTAHEQQVALHLLAEGQELVRYLRDEDWNTITGLTVGSTYSLSVTTTTVSIGAVPEVIDGTYTRTVTARRAYRDSDDDLTTEALGSNDPGSRWIDVSVSWGSNSVSNTALLTNIFNI